MNWMDKRPEDLDGHRFRVATRSGGVLEGTLRIMSPHLLKDGDDLAAVIYRTPDGSMHLNDLLFSSIEVKA